MPAREKPKEGSMDKRLKNIPEELKERKMGSMENGNDEEWGIKVPPSKRERRHRKPQNVDNLSQAVEALESGR